MPHSDKPFAVYSIADPAIDLLAMSRDAKRYLMTRDESLIKSHAGSKPTRFVMRRLTGDELAMLVQRESTDQLQARAAFRYAVSAIHDLDSQQTGQPIRCHEPDDRIQLRDHMVDYFSDEALEHIAPAYIEEIGRVAFERSFLPRASAVSYQPPRSCLAVLAGRLVSLGAEIAAGTPSSQTSGKPPAKTSPRAGARDTAATAAPRKARKKASRKPRAKSKK